MPRKSSTSAAAARPYTDVYSCAAASTPPSPGISRRRAWSGWTRMNWSPSRSLASTSRSIWTKPLEGSCRPAGGPASYPPRVPGCHRIPAGGGGTGRQALPPATAGGQLDAAIAKVKKKPALFGGIAAAVLAVVIAVGVLSGGGKDDGPALKQSPVSSVTIAGETYSTTNGSCASRAWD